MITPLKLRHYKEKLANSTTAISPLEKEKVILSILTAKAEETKCEMYQNTTPNPQDRTPLNPNVVPQISKQSRTNRSLN